MSVSSDFPQSAQAARSTTALGHKLFTMVVVADTHLSERDMESNSPFHVNRLANGRLRHVIEDINSIEPDFVINLGDLIHPIPGVPHAYSEAVSRFLEQTRKLNCKQYLVPGNHDVGDKPTNWAPAGVVCDDYLRMWEKHFGDHYYAFEHKGCHFIVVNAQIINTGLPSEHQQRDWLERFLSEHEGERLFINIHYPPYLTLPDEEEHYDNIAEPGRSWLLDLMARYRIEALFAGHVHNFWYDRYADTDCYLLPSTAFVRQDYSEMYRVPPQEGEEHGRNEEAKLGYFKVHVYERGHVCHVVRTYGRLACRETAGGGLGSRNSIHPAENRNAPLGFDLRQSWAEVVEVPPSGGLDEFARKPVRNDYPLMALWEMGIRKLRVPLQDLTDFRTRERMRILRYHGHEFTVFGSGQLSNQQRTALIEYQELVSSWEVTVGDSELESLSKLLSEMKPSFQVPVFLSRLRTHDDVKQDGALYFHVINHGFTVDDRERIETLIANHHLGSLVDGIVIRIAWVSDPWKTIAEAGRLARDLKLRVSAHVRMAGENPAQANLDELASSNRIASALVAAKCQRGVDAYVDTFADNDRGYFVKYGVVDRRSNPRLAAHVIRNLYAQLNQLDGLEAIDSIELVNGQILTFTSDTGFHALVLPTAPMYLSRINCGEHGNRENDAARLVNLGTGGDRELISRQVGNELILSEGELYQVPTLLSWLPRELRASSVCP